MSNANSFSADRAHWEGSPLPCSVWARAQPWFPMWFAVVSIIYAGSILLFLGTAALILLTWTRRRYPHKSPSDLHYIGVSIILLASAGIGMFVASQIVVAFGYMG